MDKRYILVDADMVVFRACSSCEREIDWGSNIWTLHVDFNEAKAYMINHMDEWIERALELDKFTGDVEVIYCFSDSINNFRKHILPTYKLNRVGKRKPIAYSSLVYWVRENCSSVTYSFLEADDVLGILATSDKYKGKSIIISADKDMHTIPTKIYNFLTDTLDNVTPEQAYYWHMYQTLVGDTADNYAGCPKVGPKTAVKILEDGEGDTLWDKVVHAFTKRGLDEKEALIQAKVSHILLAGDYNERTKMFKEWTPKNLS